VFARRIDDHLSLTLASVLDAPALFALIERHRDEFDHWFMWTRAVTSVEAARDYLIRAGQGWADLTEIVMLVRQDERIVGYVSVHHINRLARRGDIGYWLDATARGHGVMTTAVRAAERLCFKDLGLHRLTIQADTDNEPSRAPARRLGYTREGVLRSQYVDAAGLPHDEVVYSLLADEWRAHA